MLIGCRCDLRIVSDANVFFIETILKHHGLVECFNEITTNPCSVDGEGRLRILPYHDFNNSSHTCNVCPPNMCKVILKSFYVQHFLSSQTLNNSRSVSLVFWVIGCSDGEDTSLSFSKGKEAIYLCWGWSC